MAYRVACARLMAIGLVFRRADTKQSIINRTSTLRLSMESEREKGGEGWFGFAEHEMNKKTRPIAISRAHATL